MTNEPIVTIKNKHVPGCGRPPEIDFDDYGYISYFEDIYGEQHLFLYDDDAGKALLYIADAGWETPREFTRQELKAERTPHPILDRILLNDSEQRWLEACLAAIRSENSRYERSTSSTISIPVLISLIH